jgi:hypothetical protein
MAIRQAPANDARIDANNKGGASGKPTVIKGKQIAHKIATRTIPNIVRNESDWLDKTAKIYPLPFKTHKQRT